MNKYIKIARKYGHANNPVLRNKFENWTDRQWDNLKPESELGQSLIASWQSMQAADLATICADKGIVFQGGDGLVGPGTKALARVARCGNPDYLAQEELEKIGGGSWPGNCDPDYQGFHVVRIYIDLSAASTQVKNWWKGIWEIVQEAYRKIGLLILETKDKSKANHTLSFKSLGGSTIGLALVGSGQTCGTQYWLQLDKNYYPSAIRVAQVLAHELAHNHGVGHINGDPIQNPSVVNSDWNGDFRGTPLGNIFTRWFGGVAVPRDDDTPPIPPTDPNPVAGRLKIVCDDQGYLRVENYGESPVTIPAKSKSKEKFLVTPTPF